MDSTILKTRQPNDARRTQRVMLSMAVTISGRRRDGNSFAEETMTSVVNAHGALILLGESVDIGTMLEIRNVKSGEERSCRVVDIGAVVDGKSRVGIKFAESSPRFWRIAFPPEDWSPRDPEAKQSSGAPAPSPKLRPSE